MRHYAMLLGGNQIRQSGIRKNCPTRPVVRDYGDIFLYFRDMNFIALSSTKTSETVYSHNLFINHQYTISFYSKNYWESITQEKILIKKILSVLLF